MARAGLAAARQRIDRRSPLPPLQWRFLRDVTSSKGSMRCAGRRFDAVLVDIDHSPRKVLHPRHAALYEPEGIVRLAGHFNPAAFSRCGRTILPMKRLNASWSSAFASNKSHVVTFDNWRGDHDASNTVYVAVKAGGRPEGRGRRSGPRLMLRPVPALMKAYLLRLRA